MRNEFLAGVDVGTQGVKAAIYAPDGRCLASAFRGSNLKRGRDGVIEEDPEDQVAGVGASLRECVRRARVERKSIACLAIAGQMAGIIGIGAKGRHVTPYDSWLDNRCAPQITFMQGKAGKEIARKTGGFPSFNHGPKILWWKRERPRVWRSIRSFVQPGAYAAMRLCGLDATKAFIDTTYLHFSGFADNRNAKWDESLCHIFRIDSAKLPGIVRPQTIVGEIGQRMGAFCGLSPGTPVVAGCGDTAASFLSCGATQEGVCIDVAGTASVFAATTRRFLPDLKTQTLSCGQSATPGLWHPYAYVNGGGMNLEWFRKEFRPHATLDELDAQLGKGRSSDDQPFFIPHLGGRVNPGWPSLRGAWAGFNWTHGVPSFYRAVLEGVALEYGLYRDTLIRLDRGFVIREMRVTGGGERSQVWNAMKAGVLGCRVLQMSRAAGAPMGAALLAGFGIGMLPDLHSAAQSWIGHGRVTRPRPLETARYGRRLKRYRGLLRQMKTWSQS